jgi:hypothetical protein
MDEFLIKYIKPLSSLKHSKLHLERGIPMNYVIAFTDATSQNYIKALKILEKLSGWSSIDIVFPKFGKVVDYGYLTDSKDLSEGENNLGRTNTFSEFLDVEEVRLVSQDELDISFVSKNCSIAEESPSFAYLNDSIAFAYRGWKYNYEVTGFWKILSSKELSQLAQSHYLNLEKIEADSDCFHINETIKKKSWRAEILTVQQIWVSDHRFLSVFLPKMGVWWLSNPYNWKEGRICFSAGINKVVEYINTTDWKIREYDGSNKNPYFDEFSSLDFTKNMKLTTDENTVDVLTIVTGEKYEQHLLRSIDSMIKNQTLFGESQKLRIWLVRNHLSKEFRQKISNLYKWNFHPQVPEVCVEIHFTSYKWFLGMFDNFRSLAEEIQLSRVLFLDVMLPYQIKRVIVKDADHIMQHGNILDFYTTDLTYEEEDHKIPENKMTKEAVFGYTPYCLEPNPKYADYRFWISDEWRRYYNDNTYHFGALGLVNIELYWSNKTPRGLINAYKGLAEKKGALNSLDQDLINLYQMVNKVVTIDEDWIWCEVNLI